MASPRLRVSELLALGPALWRERSFLLLPLANAVLPGAVLARAWRRSGARDIIYLSEEARARYVRAGLPSGRQLVPQVAAEPFRGARREERHLVCYLGPPLEARGAWTAVRAFEEAAERGLAADLLLLVRPDAPPSLVHKYRRRVASSPYSARITLDETFYDPDALARRLEGISLFLLPFRAPVSEVPLVVIEAGLSGRNLVTLDAPGVGEYARALGGTVVETRRELAGALIRAGDRPGPAARESRRWSRWDEAVAGLDEPFAGGVDGLRFLGLVGVDGVGKTHLVRQLGAALDRSGVPHRHVWSRFRNYSSKPLLGLLRLTGHNRKERVDGVTVGYHDLQRSRPLALLFLALQTVDQIIDLLVRYRLGGSRHLILGDRCVVDTLVDLAIDTGLDDLVLERLGPRLLRLLPCPRHIVLVRRDGASIRRDRPDALADRHFARRRALYERLARIYGFPVVENDGPAADLARTILDAAATASVLGDRP